MKWVNFQKIKGIHETIKQKNTPVLEDEGGLNVFTTE